MPSVLITLTEDDSRLKIGKLAVMCKAFLPSTLIWVNIIAGVLSGRNSLTHNNKILLAIVCTLPVIACSSERTPEENHDLNQI